MYFWVYMPFKQLLCGYRFISVLTLLPVLHTVACHVTVSWGLHML